MAPQFTESAQAALSSAVQDAEKRRHTEITEHHVLYAFFQEPQGYFQTLSSGLNLDPSSLIQDLEAKLASLPSYSGDPEQPTLNSGLQSQINRAQVLASKWNDSYISSDHFFYVFWEKSEEPFST